MTWSESISSLEDAPQTFRIVLHLTVKQLLQSGSLLQETNALLLSHLLNELDLDAEDENHLLSTIVEQLLMCMPVLSVCRGSLQSCVLVNMMEFFLLNGMDAFAHLLLFAVGG